MQMRLSNSFVKTSFSLPNTINNAVTAVETQTKNKAIELNCSIESSINNIFGNQLSIEEAITKNELLHKVEAEESITY